VTQAGGLTPTPHALKSPRRKLVKFFEKSRNQWKAKSIDAKVVIKKLKNRIRYSYLYDIKHKTAALLKQYL
jgi:hypothetical protein